MIVHLNKRYLPHVGGVERALHTLAAASVRRGLRVSALVCAPGPRAFRTVMDGVDVRGVPSFGVFQSVPISPTYFALPSRGVSVWHLHEPFPLGTAALLLRIARAKVNRTATVVTWHSDVIRQRALRPCHTLLARRVLAKADLIHVATSAHIDNSEVLGEFRAKVRVIPFIVDIDRFARVPAHPMARRMRDWAGRAPIALFVGRLVYYKGLDVLVEAIARCPSVRLVVAGDGPLRPATMARAADLGVADRILWLGTVSDHDLVGVYSGADFLVLPSTARAEAFGLVQVEAMAGGLPVISTRLATGVDVVNVDGVSGRLVTPGNALALGEAIGDLADASDARQRLASGARARAEDFSESRLIRQYGALYEEARSAR